MSFSHVFPTIVFLIAIISPGLSMAADDAPQPIPSQTSTDTSPKGGPASSTTKMMPPTASETPSPPDASVDYKPSCQPLTDVLKIDSKLGATRLDADAQFAALRDARQNVVRAIQQASSGRELLKTRLDGRRRQYSYMVQTPVMTATKVVPTMDELRKELIDLALQAEIVKRQMDNAKQPDLTETLRSKLDEINRKATQSRIDMDIEEERAKTNLERAQREQIAVTELRNSVTRDEAAVQAATADIECLTALENKIDANIYSTLIPETQKNQFKLWMSGLFALMVFSVILGFFTVALKDAAIRAAIFSNQTGIQFVTLFSLVIAIILFGITGILEAKELSALLGGISGYILGRVTTDRTTGSATAAPHRNGTVKAQVIEFAAPNLIKNPAGGLEIFAVNSRIRVQGSAANSGDYSVTSVSATELAVAEQSIKHEQAGPAITITAI